MSFNISVQKELINDISEKHLYVNNEVNININNTNIVEIKKENNNNVIIINSDISNENEYIGYGIAPIGIIVIWSGDENGPGGCWAICDGNNETPDLRGKFIISSTYSSTLTINGESTNYSLSQTGGKQYVTLENEEMPSHTHSGLISSSGSHQHRFEIGGIDDGNFTSNQGQIPPSDRYDRTGNEISTHDSGDHTHGLGTTSSVGGGQSHENRPPFYVLTYIMRIF
jgi:microcystin-dependent protein